MVRIEADGKLQRIKNAMNMKTFAQIRPAMTRDLVLRIPGPSDHSGSADFKARDERVLQWRFCSEWNERARFNVLFDGSKEVVRSTLSLTL